MYMRGRFASIGFFFCSIGGTNSTKRGCKHGTNETGLAGEGPRQKIFFSVLTCRLVHGAQHTELLYIIKRRVLYT